MLSAVEGLKLVTPAFEPYVLPLSLVILVGLFAVQSHGTAQGGRLVRPDHRRLVRAHGARRARPHRATIPASSPRSARPTASPSSPRTARPGFVALGAVFLAVTGAEALYADMGHFGRAPDPDRLARPRLPCLALNYLGQGALLLGRPGKIENPFFLLYPDWALLPLVGWRPWPPSSPARR